MIKTLVVGIWACVIALAASQGMNAWMRERAARPTPIELAAFDSRKTKEINVPMIREGAVKGYVVVQLSYVVDVAVAKTLPVPPDAFVVDETFQFIYDDDKIDFTHLDRIDLDKMTQLLIQKVNTRLRANVITEMGVVECNFLLNNEVKAKL
jgi:hypothetical protein